MKRFKLIPLVFISASQLCASASLREKTNNTFIRVHLVFVLFCVFLWLLKKGIVIEIIVSVISCVVINITQCVSVLVKSNEMQGKNLIFSRIYVGSKL